MVKNIQTICWQFADELFECTEPSSAIDAQRVRDKIYLQCIIQKGWNGMMHEY